MSVPTGDLLRFAGLASSGPSVFEPGVALAILDHLLDGNPAPEAGAAWEAAWIACLTGSPLWAERARRAFTRATGDVGSRADRRPRRPNGPDNM